MAEWYRPLRRLIESAPRGALRQGRVDPSWIENQRAAGRVTTEDVGFGLERDPTVRENFLSTNPRGVAARAQVSPFRMEMPLDNEMERLLNNMHPERMVDSPHYHHYQLHSPNGSNYREIVLRSPDMPSAGGQHFRQNLRGGRYSPVDDDFGGGSDMPDDVLGWIRMQDRLLPPPGEGVSSPHRPYYSWLDEAQSDRFKNLRETQRAIRDMNENLRMPGASPEGRAWTEANLRDFMARDLPNAQTAMGPWGERNWQDLLFRRAMQDAADSGHGRLAWTSGMDQGLRTPWHAGVADQSQIGGAYAGQYDRDFPRLARREARRLGLPEDVVGTGTNPRTIWELRDNRPREAGGQRSWFTDRPGMVDELGEGLQSGDEYIERMWREPGFRIPTGHGDYDFSWREPRGSDLSATAHPNVQVPFHYFDLSGVPLEQLQLPYFRRGGRT